MTQPLKIAIAADHRGFALKQKIIAALPADVAALIDCGTFDESRVDALDYAVDVTGKLKNGEVDRGILICGSGYMMAISANRFPFIRAATCASAAQAEAARAHNDINVLSLAADYVDTAQVMDIVRAFITTEPASDPRYAARRAALAALDPTQFD